MKRSFLPRGTRNYSWTEIRGWVLLVGFVRWLYRIIWVCARVSEASGDCYCGVL